MFINFQHRFYGESLPFGKDSYKSAETLGYLNSQQALADYAVLIRSLKHNLSSNASPVLVFGGSYGGSKFNLPLHHILCDSVCVCILVGLLVIVLLQQLILANYLGIVSHYLCLFSILYLYVCRCSISQVSDHIYWIIIFYLTICVY